MTVRNLSEYKPGAWSIAEIETAARNSRNAYVAGLIRNAFQALATRIQRSVAPSPALLLHAMDDRMLADLGITRGGIEDAVRNGRPCDRARETVRRVANDVAKPKVYVPADHAA
ncbi:hypothetical protein [Arenibaculum pallidiluteum]|uniref:hypothetical protein n=1 Tax=Arenibaculum pallidiluteum TaxID=2812559 RepID=UPI001A97192A|nr:hypothetical protein [Arenibaculum pallidiluteum]